MIGYIDARGTCGEQLAELEAMLYEWRDSEGDPDDELCRSHDQYLEQWYGDCTRKETP